MDLIRVHGQSPCHMNSPDAHHVEPLDSPEFCEYHLKLGATTTVAYSVDLIDYNKTDFACNMSNVNAFFKKKTRTEKRPKHVNPPKRCHKEQENYNNQSENTRGRRRNAKSRFEKLFNKHNLSIQLSTCAILLFVHRLLTTVLV